MRVRSWLPIGLILVLVLAPFSQVKLNELEDPVKGFSGDGALTFVNDVPSWQIDDKWVYETDFDVAGLLSQVNVPASVNTLTGDTTEVVEDINFHNLDGTQHLVYIVRSEGDFTSGNNGATLDGYTGRLDIEYEGEDLIRVSDLATISSSFSINVEFLPYNLGILSQDIADITILNSYDPPLEKYDFPVALGENWYVETQQETDGSGQSDYFEPDDIDQAGAENYSFQVSNEGVPEENGTNIAYSGCSNSYKINQWNASGVKSGFTWYCPAVRGKAWWNTYISLGLEIDWMLKEYTPANSSGVTPGSNPGSRQISIDVEPQFPAALPNAEETIWGNYSWNGGPNPNTNLQVRWEIDGGIWNINTDANGYSYHNLSVGSSDDDSPSSDDMGSHGIIFWDPVQKIVGTRTIILDPDVVGIDLAARADHILIERIRGDESTFLSEAVGWNAVPGDLLKMSLPAQNLGILVSDETELEVNAPDGSTIRGTIPQLSAYQEARVNIEWTVPEEQGIGTVGISFEVDPDGLITEDANLSNNFGYFEIYIGRLVQPNIAISDPVLTFVDARIDATSSFDPDGGTFRCEFRTFSADEVEFNEWEDDCIWEFNWSDDGEWPVDVYIIDDENDKIHIIIYITVTNRAPWLNLSAAESVIVGERITIDASDHGDLDTITPQADVSISWPGMMCEEGAAAHACTFTPSDEGNIIITAVATDDDNDTTSADVMVHVLNRAPSISSVAVFNETAELTTIDGTYDVTENEDITLVGRADDSLNDLNGLVFNWWLDATDDENQTKTTFGWESTVSKSWQSSGLHLVWVEVWDDDSVSSQRIELQFMVENIAPTMDPLPQIWPVLEDQMVWINASGADSPADMQTWLWCWDLEPYVNSDGNGSESDDCDIEGPSLATSWTNAGLHGVVVFVTDDDGASVSQSLVVDVRNKAPTAVIELANASLPKEIVLTVGESLSFGASNSSDSESDMATLRYLWDHDGLDGNGDGDLSNDIEYEGMYYQAEFDRIGTYTITLSVVDDDGERDMMSIEVVVEPEPEEGLFEAVLSGGTGTTIGIGALLLVVILLLVVVMLRRVSDKVKSEVDWNALPLESGLLQQSTTPSSPDQPSITQSAGYEPVQNLLSMPPPVTPVTPFAPVTAPADTPFAPVIASAAPVTAPAAAPVVSNTPPIPAGGLPAGWTMEQWEHYGEQWLAQNMTVAQPALGLHPQPTSSNVEGDLSDLLDDIGL